MSEYNDADLERLIEIASQRQDNLNEKQIRSILEETGFSPAETELAIEQFEIESSKLDSRSGQVKSVESSQSHKELKTLNGQLWKGVLLVGGIFVAGTVLWLGLSILWSIGRDITIELRLFAKTVWLVVAAAGLCISTISVSRGESPEKGMLIAVVISVITIAIEIFERLAI